MSRHSRRSVAAVLLSLGVVVAACTSTASPRRSAMQKNAPQYGGVSSTELRLRLYELPARLGGLVETSADRIRSESSDPAVWRRSLLWKAEGIPAIYNAALRPDPLAGALDLWTLVYQMDDYYRLGAGKAAFGPQQPIALAASGDVVALTDLATDALYTDKDVYAARKAAVREFARAHPIDGPFSARESALTVLARFADTHESGVLTEVGEATETLTDISLRLNAYVTLLPKVARWQAELAMVDVTGREDLRGSLDQLESIGDMARRASALLADVPGTVRQASGPIDELIDRQRAEVLAVADQERVSLTGFITSEREAALVRVAEERKAALDGVAREREAALAGVDALAKRSLEDATGRARALVDYVFLRALILVVVAAMLFAIAYRLARGARTAPGSA